MATTMADVRKSMAKMRAAGSSSSSSGSSKSSSRSGSSGSSSSSSVRRFPKKSSSKSSSSSSSSKSSSSSSNSSAQEKIAEIRERAEALKQKIDNRNATSESTAKTTTSSSSKSSSSGSSSGSSNKVSTTSVQDQIAEIRKRAEALQDKISDKNKSTDIITPEPARTEPQVSTTSPEVKTTTDPDQLANIKTYISSIQDQITSGNLTDEQKLKALEGVKAAQAKLAEIRSLSRNAEFNAEEIAPWEETPWDDTPFEKLPIEDKEQEFYDSHENAMIGGSEGVSTGIAGLIAMLETQNAQQSDEYAQISKQISDFIAGTGDQQDAFEDALDAYEIPEIRKNLEELNLDLARIKGELGEYDLATAQGMEGITGQQVPQGLLVGQSAAYQRQRDIGRAGLASELAANAALQTAYTQNMDLAINLAKSSVDYKWQAMSSELQGLQVQLGIAKDYMDRDDAKQMKIFEVLYADHLNQIKYKREDEAKVMELATLAAGMGAPLSAVKSAIASGDPDKALAILSEYLREDEAPELGEIEMIDGQPYRVNPETGVLEAVEMTVTDAQRQAGIESLVEQHDLISSLLNNKVGLEKSTTTSPSPLDALRKLPWNEDRHRFLAEVDQFISSTALGNLIAMKQRGATFGGLSEGELRILQSAVTSLAGKAVRDDKTGELLGFRLSDEAVRNELNRIQDKINKGLEEEGVNIQTENIRVDSMGNEWIQNLNGKWSKKETNTSNTSEFSQELNDYINSLDL
jgi:hypothetical protein